MWYPKNGDYSRSFASAPKSQVCNSGSFSELMFLKNIFNYHLGKFKYIYRDSCKLLNDQRSKSQS